MLEVIERTKVKCLILTKSKARTSELSDVIWLIINLSQDFSPINILCKHGQDPMKTELGSIQELCDRVMDRHTDRHLPKLDLSDKSFVKNRHLNERKKPHIQNEDE